MLLGIESTPENAMAVGVGGIILSCLGLVIGGVKYAIDKLAEVRLKKNEQDAKRDEQKNTVEIALLKERQAQCEKESQKCLEDREKTLRELAALHARDAADRAALQAQIDAIKAKVN